MMKKPKIKKIWIKRIYNDRDMFDYFKMDSDKVEMMINNHKINPNPNFYIEKAPFYISIKNNIIDLFIHKKTWDLIKIIIVFILGCLSKYFYDNWF